MDSLHEAQDVSPCKPATLRPPWPITLDHALGQAGGLAGVLGRRHPADCGHLHGGGPHHYDRQDQQRHHHFNQRKPLGSAALETAPHCGLFASLFAHLWSTALFADL